MENENTANEPQAYYGSLTPAERDIIRHLSLMRDDQDAMRRIQVFVHLQSQKKEKKASQYSVKTEDMPAYKKFAGFLTETGESDSDRLSRILRQKHMSI